MASWIIKICVHWFMFKLLIDTNILIYGIDQDSQFFKRGRMIMVTGKLICSFFGN